MVYDLNYDSLILPPEAEPTKGTKRQGSKADFFHPDSVFSTQISCCPVLSSKGITSLPPILSCSSRWSGILEEAALTRMASKGSSSFQPYVPSLMRQFNHKKILWVKSLNEQKEIIVTHVTRGRAALRAITTNLNGLQISLRVSRLRPNL